MRIEGTIEGTGCEDEVRKGHGKASEAGSQEQAAARRVEKVPESDRHDREGKHELMVRVKTNLGGGVVDADKEKEATNHCWPVVFHVLLILSKLAVDARVQKADGNSENTIQDAHG